MKRVQRREFLKRVNATGLGMTAGVTILANACSVRANPVNDRVVLGLIGAGGRGPNLANGFLDRGDCEFAFIADPNTNVLDSHAERFAKRQGGRKPKCVDDMRKVFDDKSVDAVVIATPDHWHALATVWSCQAGKDVYVEKAAHPQSCWEGQKMLEAARKYKRIVQCADSRTAARRTTWRQKSISKTASWATVHLLPNLQPKAAVGKLPGRARIAIRPRGSTGTCGTGRLPNTDTIRAGTIAGTTNGDTRAATSPTTPAIKSTWHAGYWESIIPRLFIPRADGSLHPAAARHPRHSGSLIRFRQAACEFRVDAFWRLYFEDRRRRPRQRHVSHTGCRTRRGSRYLRHQRHDGRRPPRRRLAGVRTSQEPPAGRGRAAVRTVP